MSDFTLALDEPHGVDLAEAKAAVGGKAASLGIMARDLGMPVPPGFVVTTETCRRFLASGWPDGLDDELRTRMAGIEAKVGRRFGDPADPLLVSVRSGAPVSMPGMMDTILDLGLDDATTAGLARSFGDAAFAASCRERLEACFRTTVGREPPDDPWQQLRLAVEAVFQSWQGDRARAYRRREGIADDLGTAVTVQAMVFGNRDQDSATGVLFTRDPATGVDALYGDVLFGAQGEDVVAGTHRTEPISVLDTRLPVVASELRGYADRLERHFRDLCDIEFTIESGRLWMLQCRVGKRSAEAALRIALEMAQDPDFPLTREEAVRRVADVLNVPPTRAVGRSGREGVLLARGLPASPGIASGPLVTDPDAAIASAAGGRPAVLVRATTSPDDVHGMAQAAGVLTSSGGLASHAAVVARGWGIPAVVGTTELIVRDGEIVVGDQSLRAGDVLTIDGTSGEVFAGVVDRVLEVVPEARILTEWARDLGIELGPAGAAAAPAPEPTQPDEAAGPAPTATDEGVPAVTADDCVRAIAIRGFATAEGVADATVSPVEVVGPILDRLSAEGLVSTSAGAFRLTESGVALAAELRSADRQAWGPDRADAALDAFVDLDREVKATVTAWQMRDPDAGVLNDHADAGYDAAVIARLADAQAAAMTWMDAIEAGFPRIRIYRIRLGRALERVQAGDGRFIASPRVDSYHGIWFELHEELIGLAGRTRAAEVDAGRA